MRRIRLAGLTWLHHIRSFALIVFACILMYTVYFQGLSVCVEDLIWKLWQVDHTGAEFCPRKPCEHPAMEAAVSIYQACHSDGSWRFFFGKFSVRSTSVTFHHCDMSSVFLSFNMWPHVLVYRPQGSLPQGYPTATASSVWTSAQKWCLR